MKYYDSFVKLALQLCTACDYNNKAEVEAHNDAMRKLKKLQEEMRKTDCKKLLEMLLIHEDDRVRVNAAAMCLETGILIDQAQMVLRNIVETSDDSTIRFSAQVLL